MATKTRSKKIPKRNIQRIVLENGVRVWSEVVRNASSAAVGVWIAAGSRYEALKESGATHILQRIALQGTENRSAEEIANEIDALGGDVDLLTKRDSAAWVARTDTSNVGKALDLLSDLALHPKITQAAQSAEQKTLLEELRVAEKDSDFNLERMFLRSLWKGHGLCRPPRGRLLTVMGKARLEDFSPKSLARFHRQTHHPKAITVTVAGDVDYDKVAALANKFFGSLEQPDKMVSTTTPTAHRFVALRNRPQFPGVRMQLGVPACGAADERRHAAVLLNAVLGRGAGSRLARLLRRKALPATEASSSLLMFADAGVLSIRLRTVPKHAVQALEKVVTELRRLTSTQVEKEELRRAKATVKLTLLSHIETPRARIEDLARQERYFGEPLDPQAEFAALDEVTPAELRLLASEWIVPHELSLAALGNLKGVVIRPKSLRW